MKWNFQIVKAKHYLERVNIPGVEQSGNYEVCMVSNFKEKDCVTKQLAYYDKVSNVLVPMLDGPLCPKSILDIEEWTESDEGFIFMDCKTHKVGLIVRG